MSNPIKATIIMVSLSSVVIFFQGISLPRLPVTTQLIILSTHCTFYFIRNNLVDLTPSFPLFFCKKRARWFLETTGHLSFSLLLLKVLPLFIKRNSEAQNIKLKVIRIITSLNGHRTRFTFFPGISC